MKDYYKISLEMLLQLLKGEGYENWEKWILDDLRLWDTEKSTDHHLRAYGGMGSFNDVVIGGQDVNGLWKSRLFGLFQTLSWSFANKKISNIPLDEDFYSTNSKELNGWRCRNCGAAKIKTFEIERFVSNYFLPKLLIKSFREDNLVQILELEKIHRSKELNEIREGIEKTIKSSKIEITESKDWNWTCPDCQSNDTCAYRWILSNDFSTVIEADDNLEIFKQNN